MDVCFFLNLRSTRPIRRSVTWEALAGRLQSFSDSWRTKAEVPLWSPARYPESATRRLGKLVDSVSCLVLDYDEGVSVDEAAERWSGHEAVIHTTWSHTWEDPRLRVVLPLAAPIRSDIWTAVYQAVVKADGGDADPACSDAGRCYLLPAKGPSGQTESRWIRGERLDLRPLAEELDRISSKQWEIVYGDRKLPPIKPCWSYSDGRRRYQIRRKMEEDPTVRQDLGIRWGGRLIERPGGAVVTGLQCPQCERSSAWYLVEPSSFRGAACQHRRTCGWAGPLYRISEAY